jgi:hypothetical protein
MRAALIACVLPLFAPAEAAAQDDACGRFSWAMGREIDLFDEPLPTLESSLSLPKEGVFTLILKPMADVIYPVTPGRGSDGSYGGYVIIESVPAGRYQIALSDDAWVDAVQDYALLATLAPDRATGCAGVRRSVQVDVKGDALTIEISGARVPRINVALLRIWPFEWKW